MSGEKHHAPPQQHAEFLARYSVRNFLHYRKASQTAQGRMIAERIKADPRVRAMDHMIVWQGTGGGSFNPDNLIYWYLWLRDRKGEEHARSALERFLESSASTVVLTQWVTGLQVEEPVDLGDGFKIQPVATMPDSDAKEHFQRIDSSGILIEPLLPRCALTRVCAVPKLLSPGEQLKNPPEFEQAERRLGILPLLLNAFEGVSCLPAMITSYTEDDTPFGPFSGSGGGFVNYDVIGQHVDRMTVEAARGLIPLLKLYETKPPTERRRLDMILLRICQAKRAGRAEDKVLDLGIALEMLLLDDNRQNDQLSLSFRLRGSWLLGHNAEERAALFKTLRTIYEARSSVAHGGSLDRDRDGRKVQESVRALPEWLNLGCRILRRIIAGPTPDWSKLVLGG